MNSGLKKTKTPVTNFWCTELDLSPARQQFALGPLQIWCKLDENELWLAHQYENDDAGGNHTAKPQDIAWARWVLKSQEDRLRFTPVLPDRPLVVKPDFAFGLLNGARARIYVHVPVWVRVERIGKKPETLVEIPTVVLSKTWFGTQIHGEHCYWLTSTASRTLDPDEHEPHMAVCPVQIVNGSDTELPVVKLALRVPRLSLFQLNGRLWSDDSRVKYSGTGDVSKIDFTGKTPQEAKGAQLLNGPRQSAGRGFAARTFSTIKELPGLDWFG